MIGTEFETLEDLCEAGRILYEKGLICSSGGNLSLRQGDWMYISSTGANLNRLVPDDLVKVRLEDGVVEGPGKPSKELGFHLGMLRAHPQARAVVHVHPTACVAFSARYPSTGLNAVPATNAGFYVRAGQIPMLPYYHSGSPELHAAVNRLASCFQTVMLANHGLIVARRTLLEAVNVTEEVEQNCQIYLLAGPDARYLTPQQMLEIDQKLNRTYPEPGRFADLFSGN